LHNSRKKYKKPKKNWGWNSVAYISSFLADGLEYAKRAAMQEPLFADRITGRRGNQVKNAKKPKKTLSPKGGGRPLHEFYVRGPQIPDRHLAIVCRSMGRQVIWNRTYHIKEARIIVNQCQEASYRPYAAASATFRADTVGFWRIGG
jgi:hypothetical protein